MKKGVTIYRCSRWCPIGKHCFILKTPSPICFAIDVLLKCPANNNSDINVTIGGDKKPP